jgi:hypothetical protein
MTMTKFELLLTNKNHKPNLSLKSIIHYGRCNFVS